MTMTYRSQMALSRFVRWPVYLGLGALIVFFLGFGVWAGLAPIARAAIAPGIVTPEGSRRMLQHLEGGVIADIRVKDGNRVEAGDILIELETKQTEAQHKRLEHQLRTLMAIEARLNAERDGDDALKFPIAMASMTLVPEQEAILLGQQSIFSARQRSRTMRKNILGQSLRQLEEEVEGHKTQVVELDRQLALIADELSSVKELLQQGLERRPRVLGLERRQSELRATRAARKTSIAQTERAIGQAQLEIINLDVELQKEVAEQLAGVRAEISDLEERLKITSDVLERAKIRAPISGTVVQLRYRTRGGVIRPGSVVLDIVPDKDELVIIANVSPLDIDLVRPGLDVQVILPALKQRNLEPIKGQVETVSADRVADGLGEQPTYQTRILVERESLRQSASDLPLKLVAGMPAEVVIYAGERTMLEYILDPLMVSMRRAFTED